MSHLIFIFKLAVRNLRLNYKRNLAALVSIVAGFISVNLFEGYIEDVQKIFDSNYGERFMYSDLMIYHQNSYQKSSFFNGTDYITKEHQDILLPYLKSLEEVDAVIRRLSFRGMVTNGNLSTPFIGDAFDVEDAVKLRLPLWGWNTSYGRPLKEGEEGILLGEELGRLLSCNGVGSPKILSAKGGYIPVERKLKCENSQLQLLTTTDYGQMNAIHVGVVGLTSGLFRDIDSRYIQAPLKQAQQLIDTQGISFMNLRLRPGFKKKDLKIKLNEFFEKHSLPLKVSSWKNNAFGKVYQQSMSFLNVMQWFFLIVILMIVMFSILATQTRLVFERIKETATLRSIGFSNRIIRKIFLVEAALMASVGSFLGALFSWAISFFIKEVGFFYKVGILSEQVPFSIGISTRNLLLGALCLIILTGIACYIPLKKALSMSISEAFSHS